MADYTQELSEKLEAARKRVRLGKQVKVIKDAAPDFFEIIDTEISLAVNKMTQDKPLDYEQYLSLHGQVVGIRRIRSLLNSKEAEEVAASQEVAAISGQLEQFRNDKKQK